MSVAAERNATYLVASGITVFALVVFTARRLFELQDQDIHILLIALGGTAMVFALASSGNAPSAHRGA